MVNIASIANVSLPGSVIIEMYKRKITTFVSTKRIEVVYCC